MKGGLRLTGGLLATACSPYATQPQPPVEPVPQAQAEVQQPKGAGSPPPPAPTPTVSLKAEGHIAIGKDIFRGYSLLPNGDVVYGRSTLNGENSQIVHFRPSGRAEEVIARPLLPHAQILAAVASGSRVVWTESNDRGWQLVTLQLTKEQPVVLVGSHMPDREPVSPWDYPMPVLDSDHVYWSELRRPGVDIFGYDFVAGRELRITTSARAGHPMASGGHLIYPTPVSKKC